MQCPHCRVAIHEGYETTSIINAGGTTWRAIAMTCPSCKQAIVKVNDYGNGHIYSAYPRNLATRPIPDEVPDPYRTDFNEAVAVLSISPKASAALTRRSLQALLVNVAGASKGDLIKQIDEITSSGRIPSHLADDLHAVRNIGNFAAHEQKSKATGEIIDVEPQEAEWNLDVLEGLFDFYFVEPAKSTKRKEALNERLKAVGKPPII